MPTVNDESNRTCVCLDLDPERSGIFTHNEVTVQFSEDDLRVFNQCAACIAPDKPALGAEQIVVAARRLARAIGQGNGSRFIRTRMRRVGEMRALLMDAGRTVDPRGDGTKLGEYADFCRYRVAEAQRLGVPIELVHIDREHWSLERGGELRLERLVCRGGDRGYAKNGQSEAFRVS